MRQPSSALVEHFNHLEFGQPTSSDTLARCSMLATAEARVAAEDWAWDLAHGIRTATERQVAWVRSQEEPDKPVGEQIPPNVLAAVEAQLAPAAAAITAVFNSVGGFPSFAPRVSHRIIQYLVVADMYDVTAEIGEANQLQPVFEAGVLPVGWDCEDDDDPNEVGFPQVWAPWTSSRPALQPWFSYGRPRPVTPDVTGYSNLFVPQGWAMTLGGRTPTFHKGGLTVHFHAEPIGEPTIDLKRTAPAPNSWVITPFTRDAADQVVAVLVQLTSENLLRTLDQLGRRGAAIVVSDE